MVGVCGILASGWLECWRCWESCGELGEVLRVLIVCLRVMELVIDELTMTDWESNELMKISGDELVVVRCTATALMWWFCGFWMRSYSITECSETAWVLNSLGI